MNDNNEPAFPCLGFYKGVDGDLHPTPAIHAGITIRDYFAAHALQGMLSYSPADPPNGDWNSNCSIDDAAKTAYQYADAMLKRIQP